MTLGQYQTIQGTLFALYLLGCPFWIMFPLMYAVLWWNIRRVDLWMRNRDERGRFVRGHGPGIWLTFAVRRAAYPFPRHGPRGA
jgi:hypothetical protein